MADYRLIVATEDAYGKLRGYSMEFSKWRSVKLVLDEIRSDEYDDRDEEDSCFFGELDVIDEDGNEYRDFPPDFATEGYRGLVLLQFGEFDEYETVDAETSHFFEKFYGITDPELENDGGDACD